VTAPRASRLRSLRGRGRWDDALALAGDDPLLRADILNEQALFAGSAEARAAATRELDRVESRLEAERGRVLHAKFLADRGEEDPRELAHFEAALAAAERAGDPLLAGWARFWIGIVHQVVRGDDAAALPHFDAAYETARATGSNLLASYAVRHLAFAWDNAGRHDEAWRGFEESVALRRVERFWPGVGAGLLTLAEVAHERGRPGEARRYLRQAKAAAKRGGATSFLPRADELDRELDATTG
jgi:tetratricopeptide (TPR) repeat protein